MRSLHVITSDARRGAETFAVGLAAALQRDGATTRVVALTHNPDGEVHDVPVLGDHRRSPKTLRGLRAAAKEADVVVAHGSSTLEACAVALRGSRTPFVYRTIGDPSYWVTTEVRLRMVATMLRLAAANVVLWPGAAEQLIERFGLPRRRVHVIPNAVPSADFSPPSISDRQRHRAELGLEPQQVCLAFVGALSPEKDVGALIDAARQLEDTVLLIAGDGPDRASLEARASGVAAGAIRFLGSVSDPVAVYAAADLLVLPSRTEGMPGVVIEAGLCGTAAVASAVGAVPDMLEHGLTGYLTPPGDASQLATAIRAALPSAPATGARAADAFAERYTMEAVVGPWSRALEAALQ